MMETKRREVTYEQVLEEAFFVEDVLKNRGSGEMKIKSNLMQLREGTVGEFLDKCNFLWHTQLRPKLFSVCGLLAIVLSI